MRDVTEKPMAAMFGFMGWPYPGHGGSAWKDIILHEGLQPQLALDDPRALAAAWEDVYTQVKAAWLEQVRAEFPIVSRWVESIDWLQERGRGDVVGIMTTHTGAVLSHACLAWREDYRDESGGLWNWDWVILGPDPLRPGRLIETRADAGGSILEKNGIPSARVLVRPTIGQEEQDGLLARWQETVGEALRETPPVRTVHLVTAETDWAKYADNMRRLWQAVEEGDYETAIKR